ncbi:MAG: nucleotidyltransferase domain-containing protein, partial [Solirubrobacteraceae bacterium]
MRVHLIGAARFVDRVVRRLTFSGVKLLRALARARFVGTAIDPLLDRVGRHDRLHFEQSELLRVCSSLNDVGLPYWLAGGWGLDAIVGSETRRHHDLDFVVYPFRENLGKVDAVLESLGYHREPPLGGTIWFPDAEVYEDGRGHHIEILNVNWEIL